MNNPSPSTPPRKKLIIPGAPIEEPSEQQVTGADEEFVEEFAEQAEAEEPTSAEVYEEDPQEPIESEEYVESVDDVQQSDEPMESEEGDFLMVDGQQVDEQYEEQASQAEVPRETSAKEPKVVRRLMPRGAVHDDTAPVPRRFSSFQTSAVSVGTGQVPLPDAEVYQEVGHQVHPAQAHVTAHHAVPVSASAIPGAAPHVQQTRPTYVPAKSGLPIWIFSLIGFLFGVLTVLTLVKLGLMPAALGLTDQNAVREAVNDERARIIKILEEGGEDAEDWDNFVDED